MATLISHGLDATGLREVALDFIPDEPPATGTTIQVAPGVDWVRLPLPFSLSHINVWLLADEGGYAIVDCGVHDQATIDAWAQVLASRPPRGDGVARVTRVLVTHMHPDHVGMAGALGSAHDCELWMSRDEYLNCRVLAADTGRAAPEAALRFFRQAGWSEAAIEHYRTRFGGFGKMISPLPENYRRLQDGDRFKIGDRHWEVVIGMGHSPEHASLYCPARRLLISGDQVLPTISSNISVHPTEPWANPLKDWLDSIDKFRRRIPDDVLVLPAHGQPFRGLHARLRRLQRGHLKALDRLRTALESPLRVVDTFSALFARPIGEAPSLLGLATGEAIAHLNYLVDAGEVVSSLDADGLRRYRLA